MYMTIPISLGRSKAGLALTALLMPNNGDPVELTSGFAEVGDGHYTLAYDFPREWHGSVVIYDTETVVGIAAVNIDAPISSEIAGDIVAGLSSTKNIYITTPKVIGGKLNIPIIQGDSYIGSRSLAFENADFPEIVPGSYIEFRASKECGDEAVHIIQEGLLVAGSGELKRISVEFSSDETGEFEPGTYRLQVLVAFPNGEEITFAGPNTLMEILPRV